MRSSTTYRWDDPFDDMKNTVIGDLLQILDFDNKDEVRKAFIESFALIPYREENRKWWFEGVKKLMSREDTRFEILTVISNFSHSPYSSYGFPEEFRPIFKKIVKTDNEKEIIALLNIYSKGYGFSVGSRKSDTLLDDEDWAVLSKHPKEKIRLAALGAFVERLQTQNAYLGKDEVNRLLSFSEDTSEKVLSLFIPLLMAFRSVGVDFDVQPLLTHKNNDVRHKAVALYLGYDLEKKKWTSPMEKPDLKIVAKLVSDAYSPIARLAEEYLDKAQSSRRW